MATKTINAVMQQKSDTSSNWSSNNPTLLKGEIGYETDTNKLKIGDGTTAWNSLSYIAGSNSSSSGDIYGEGSTSEITINYDGTEPSSAVWGLCWGTTKHMVKCAEYPSGTISFDDSLMSGIRVDNQWLGWSRNIQEADLDKSEPGVIFINYQNGTAEPQAITRAAIVKIPGTYNNMKIYSETADIKFTQAGIYLLDNHLYAGGNDYTSTLTLKVTTSSTNPSTPSQTISNENADYTGTEIQTFSKGICIGDSITEGVFNASGDTPYYTIKKYSYPTILSKITGIDIVNAGIAGSTAPTWYAASLDSHSLYGTWQSDGEWKWNDSTSSLNYSGFDFAIIHLGINDIIGITESNPLETVITNYETAIKNIITKLKEANTGIKIFLCTIIPNYVTGETHHSLNNKIKSIAQELESVYLIDLTTYSKCLATTYYSNGHLTAIGYYQMAKEIAAMISYTMKQNLGEFNAVQFIGTDYTI